MELLREIATSTGGQFYEATSKADLAEIYDEIGRLETSQLEGQVYERWVEVGPWLLLSGALLLIVTFVLRGTWLRSGP